VVTTFHTDLLDGVEVAALIRNSAGQASTLARNRALVALLYYSGLQVGEILRLRARDIVSGKEIAMGQAPPLILADAAAAVLSSWLEARSSLGLRDSQPLFSTLDGKTLSGRQVRDLVARSARNAGISKAVGPEILRRSRAAHLAAHARIEPAIDQSPPEKPSPPSARLHPFGLDATVLDGWSTRREAQEILPKLIRLLVHGDVESRRLQLVTFRSGEGVQLGGWDGLVNADQAGQFVPSGMSAWELGTGADVSAKATADFETRTADPRVVSVKATTFVFVTSRRWRDKHLWAMQMAARSAWAGIRAYDADDLELWLELVPAAAAWFATVVGTRRVGVSSLAEAWPAFASATDPPLSRRLILDDREEVIGRLTHWLDEPPSILELEGESVQEVVAFVGAALESLPEQQSDPWRARGLVIEDTDAWRELAVRPSGTLVVLVAGSAAHAAALKAEGHHVLVPVVTRSYQPGDRPRLGRILPETFEHGLVDMGFQVATARRLSLDASRSLPVLRRQLAQAASLAEPEWAKPEVARTLMPALLIGTWDEEVAGDREAISKLAGRDYRQFRDDITRWLSGPDAPLRRVSSTVGLTAPMDAWKLLSCHLYQGDIDVFETLAIEILGRDDPKFDLPPERRGATALSQQALPHSPNLRAGLADSLALAATIGDESGVDLQRRFQDVVESIVRRLLRGAQGSRWNSLRQLLPTLAEAAPEAFLAAVEAALQQDPSPLIDLFADEGFLGGSGHYHLQWALEGLAWNPSFLGQVTLALGRLAAMDPGGVYSNRPAETLRTIFLPWLRRTAATPEQRQLAIGTLLEHLPEVGWKLLVSLLPVESDMATPGRNLRWRVWDGNVDERFSETDWRHFTEFIVARAFVHAGNDLERWHQVVDKMNGFPPELRSAVRDHLRRLPVHLAPDPSRALLAQSLTRIVSRNRRFPDAEWAMAAEEVDDLEALLRSVQPVSPAERYSGLFESDWPTLAEPEKESYQEQREAIQRARDQSVRDTLLRHGIDDVLQLARAVRHPEEVGAALARVYESDAMAVLSDVLPSTDEAARVFALGFVRQLSRLAGTSWSDDLLSAARRAEWPMEALVDLCCGFPPGRPTWTKVSELGAEAEQLYWRKMPFAPIDSLEDRIFALRQLIAVGRAADALWWTWIGKDDLPPEILLETLEAVAAGESPATRQPNWYEISGVFTTLEARADLDRSRLARLEWKYYGALRHSDCKPQALYELVRDNPAFFATLVSWVFRADESSTPDDSSDAPPTEAVRVQAYRLLNSWDLIPGLRDDGSLDSSSLEEWVLAARGYCSHLSRVIMGDQMIGVMLAGAPFGADNLWPIEPVRRLVETLHSEHLEAGLQMGLANRDGTASGNLHTAFSERASRWRQNADGLAFSSPRVSSVLRGLANSYEAIAQGERQRSRAGDLQA
jgi:Phage integrase family